MSDCDTMMIISPPIGNFFPLRFSGNKNKEFLLFKYYTKLLDIVED